MSTDPKENDTEATAEAAEANDDDTALAGADPAGADQADAATPEPAESSPWSKDPAARIAELEAEAAALKDQLLRAMAETENVRKRSERQIAEAHKYAIANFARAMLTIADDLSRALAAVPEDQRAGDGLLQTLLGGVEAVERELMKGLEAHGIERIDPTGEPFDPNLHEAMYEVPAGDLPHGTVAQVLQPGYRLHDRLLRPARVGVAKGENAAPPPGIDTKV